MEYDFMADLENKYYDLAVIGGGIVGCAVARRMALAGAKVILIEKAPDILAGASKGNSAILHTAFDAPEKSLELQCMQSGYAEYLDIHQSMNLPLLKTGALLAAWSPEEEAKFDAIITQAKNNGVIDLKLLSANAARNKEPELSSSILAAIEVPREYVIDPWSAPLAYLTQAIENGADTLFNSEIIGGDFDRSKPDGNWLLETSNNNQIKADHVVNCAGLYGDFLNKDVLGSTDFEIRPRKGEFVVFDKAASKLLKNILLPIPTEITKGIVIFPTIFGNIAVGPTADEQLGRADASVAEENLEMLYAYGLEKIPALKQVPVTATYAGIRPATEKKHYRVKYDIERQWITLGGIRSTGLTGSLGLAQHVQDLFSKQGVTFKKLNAPSHPVMPNLAEHLERDWQKPEGDEIVCHCEMVTKREINNAMSGTLPAVSVEGLKRRTRITMGRCQGFYCTARLAELTEGKFVESFAVTNINGENNNEK
ncbi:MAG: NAD(P)/FAD-dependent oxidoreductase [Cocleimonas sp.]